MTPTLTVSHVVLSLECGGLERVVLDLVRQGQQLGQHVHVICLERPGVLAGEVETLGATLTCLHKPARLSPGLVSPLKDVLRGQNPDVVHTHQIGALLYTGRAARQTGMPVVVHTEHGKHYPSILRRRILGRLAGRQADRFFCVTQDIADLIATWRIVPRRKLAVVTNGIDTDRFRGQEAGARVRQALGISSEALIVGTVGRLNEIKRQDLLMRAFAQLIKRVPNAHLLLVGDGPQMSDLCRLAIDLRVGQRVHFAGYQAQPEHYLQAMDVFALTSRSEGMPLAILEAWASGVPVVASRVGGLPELIEDGRTGLLFPPDQEQTLVGSLLRLLSDPMLRQSLSEAGRQRVEASFSVRRMAADYQAHYRELLGQPQLVR